MKKLWMLLTVCGTVSLSASAQITIDSSDYGRPGDKVLYGIDTTVTGTTISAGGPNQTWHYETAVDADTYDSTEFFSTAGDPNAPAGANLRVTSGSNGDQYLQITGTYMKGLFDQPQFNLTGVSIKVASFPTTYLTATDDSTHIIAKGKPGDFGIPDIQGFDSVSFDVHIHVSTLCDAWGTIFLPDNSSPDVLRIKTSTVQHIAITGRNTLTGAWIPLGNQDQSTGNYAWYGKHTRGYVAQAELDENGNLMNIAYKVPAIPAKFYSKITSVSPNTAAQGTTLDVTITGTNTNFAQGSGLTVSFGQGSSVTVTAFHAVDNNTIVATLAITATANTGFYNLEVIDPVYGFLGLADAFQVTTSSNAPHISGISPNYGSQGQTLDVTISGTNTTFTQGSTSVYIQQSSSSVSPIQVNSTTILSDTEIKCNVTIDAAGAAGVYSVYVDNPNWHLSLPSSFSIVHTGINELGKATAIMAYPNPVKDQLTIRLNQADADISTLLITDVTGRKVHEAQHPATSADGTIVLDVKQLNLQSGTYFIRLATANNQYYHKMMVE